MGDAETIGIYVVASASTRRPFYCSTAVLTDLLWRQEELLHLHELVVTTSLRNYALNTLCSRTAGGYEVLEMVMTFQT